MARRLRSSRPEAPRRSAEIRPLRIGRAILFHWVNPKVWAVAIAAASGHGAGLSHMAEAQRLARASSGLNLLVCLFRSFAGSLLALLLAGERAWTFSARVMAVGPGASAVMVFP